MWATLQYWKYGQGYVTSQSLEQYTMQLNIAWESVCSDNQAWKARYGVPPILFQKSYSHFKQTERRIQ